MSHITVINYVHGCFCRLTEKSSNLNTMINFKSKNYRNCKINRTLIKLNGLENPKNTIS